MRRHGFGSLIAVLCVAILFVFFTSPNRENISAQQVEQAKSGIAEVEQLKDGFIRFIEMQGDLNSKLNEADAATVGVLGDLAGKINDLSKVVKLAAFTAMETDDEKCNCTCGERLAAMQKQIDELVLKVATLESAKTSTAAAVASSYGTASPAKTASSGGSTGTVSAGYGSTGSAVRSSGGSTGTVVYQLPAYQPVVEYSQPVQFEYPASPVPVQTVYQSPDCYIDANGNQVCPQRAQQTGVVTGFGLGSRLRSRFGR